MERLTVKGGGERWGIGAGDRLLEVNGHAVGDIIDWVFYLDSPRNTLKIKDKLGKIRKIKVDESSKRKLQFEPMINRSCPNHCLFCFVDQLPPGLRKSLYFKDEDYRLSFLFGNYITLTNLSENDLKRIIAQRLSPLYISVHTTDDSLRRKMLGNPKAPPLLPLLRRLTRGGIELHTQIVLCPGINDGPHLRKAVWDLSPLYPKVRSVAIIPVGLTKWREGLYPLHSLGKKDCLHLIKEVEDWRERFQTEIGSGFVWLADEIYLKTGRRIPPSSYYEDFPQLEDGVGMWRKFKDRWRKLRPNLGRDGKGNLRITLVTGKLAQGLMKGIRDDLNSLPNVEAKLLSVSNQLLGEEITVSGLLSGRDILEGVNRFAPCGDALFLPPNCLNEDRRFLDDLSPAEMERRLNCQIFFNWEEGLKALSLLREDSLETLNDASNSHSNKLWKTELSFPR